MTLEPATVEIALISHTNAGKTTLARTLLGRDIGEVRDAPHVTDVAESHPLLTSVEGDVLRLTDTPGFGDSAKLVQRLRVADNPLGWLLREVWDRYSDRPFWCSQQAVRAARDSADVVLYLVNAAEDPRDAGYVALEMQVLRWVGKPVLVLLNQVGPPRGGEDEHRDVERWRTHLAPHGIVQRRARLRRVRALLGPGARAVRCHRRRHAFASRGAGTTAGRLGAGAVSRASTRRCACSRRNSPRRLGMPRRSIRRP